MDVHNSVLLNFGSHREASIVPRWNHHTHRHTEIHTRTHLLFIHQVNQTCTKASQDHNNNKHGQGFHKKMETTRSHTQVRTTCPNLCLVEGDYQTERQTEREWRKACVQTVWPTSLKVIFRRIPLLPAPLYPHVGCFIMFLSGNPRREEPQHPSILTH